MKIHEVSFSAALFLHEHNYNTWRHPLLGLMLFDCVLCWRVRNPMCQGLTILLDLFLHLGTVLYVWVKTSLFPSFSGLQDYPPRIRCGEPEEPSTSLRCDHSCHPCWGINGRVALVEFLQRLYKKYKIKYKNISVT